MSGTVHVIGAGMAGLAAAVALTQAGRHVVLHEAAGRAGGRCRSFVEPALDRLIDNGNHLILSGNGAIHSYLSSIGATEALCGPDRAEFPFIDLRDGLRWTLRPGGAIPTWLLDAHRRVPGTSPGAYLRALRLARAGADDTVAKVLNTDGPLYRRFWEPVTVAVLNTAPEEAAAALLWPVVKETFGRGEAACRPRLARRGLGPSLIDPAVHWLQLRGVEVRFNRRLRGIVSSAGRVEALSFVDGGLKLASDEGVVLAVPPNVAADLLPGLVVPTDHRAIVNGHFRLPAQVTATAPFMVGVVGGTAQWVFVREDVASVTVSAADTLAEQPAESIASVLWPEVTRVLDMAPAPLPPYRIVKEKRATFAQTPEQVRRRPATASALANLWLAGDWTDTGLPATIEGAVRSGHSAAVAAAAMVRERLSA